MKGGCLGLVIGAALGSLVEAWILMLILGAFHHSMDARVPALGFWWVLLIMTAINIVFGGRRASRS